ncbi:uncharacterized protein HaLaN_03919 [Haematococcus lacustris]|uniref:Uncharacterized protein n=1 Tax=Haematococcus lacustris TaxID=44745 RepID=A0A699YFD5_HAELA|nr:uncharacterized protein HaLaN_03919 [Haematococcus lacustris]
MPHMWSCHVEEVKTHSHYIPACYSFSYYLLLVFLSQLCTAANQATTEMKDKSKILHNEQDILHNEVNVKDRLLNQSRNQHGIAVTERDALRIELGKYGATFRDKQDRVDEQIADVDKLNAIINLTEKDMLKLRKQVGNHATACPPPRLISKRAKPKASFTHAIIHVFC